MIPLTGAVKIYYCRTPINLHRSFDGLPGAVEEYLKQDPKSGHLFVFFNRTCRMVKILYWDGDGYAICNAPRLSRAALRISGQKTHKKFFESPYCTRPICFKLPKP